MLSWCNHGEMRKKMHFFSSHCAQLHNCHCAVSTIAHDPLNARSGYFACSCPQLIIITFDFFPKPNMLQCFLLVLIIEMSSRNQNTLSLSRWDNDHGNNFKMNLGIMEDAEYQESGDWIPSCHQAGPDLHPRHQGGRRGVLATVIIIQPCPGRSPPLCSVVQYLHSAQFNIHTGRPCWVHRCTIWPTDRHRAVLYGSDNYTVRPHQWHLPKAAAAPSSSPCTARSWKSLYSSAHCCCCWW